MNRIGKKEKKYVNDILDNNLSYDVGKKYVRKFENKFAEKFDCKYAISAVNGTATMHAILAGMGIKDGDEVIVPGLTMLSTALTVLHCGALPVFADVDPDTFQISVESIKKCITERTKAIQIVSLYGLCPDMDEIMKIAEENNLYVIEDNAECFLGYYKGKIVGSIGHAASFSLQNSKHITSGEGGVITTNDINLAHKIRRFTIIGYESIGELAPPNLTIRDFQHPNFHRHASYGYNYRMAGILAAVGLGQLERIDELVNWRIKTAKMYERAIEETKCDWLIPQKVPDYCVSSYWTYVCKLDTTRISWYDFRNKFIEIGGEPFFAAWVPCHLETCMIQQKMKPYQWQIWDHNLCPNVEKIQKQIIQFQTNYLDDNKINKQYESLKKTIEYFNNVEQPKVFAVISCRLGSSRLPNKGIKKINGKESIIRCIENIKQTSGIHKIIVATTNNKEDDELEKIVKEYGYDVFRGSSDNVLQRLVFCLREFGAKENDIMIRGMADDVCVSPEILNIMIASHKEKNSDVTLCYPGIYPDGVIGELYSVGALEKLYKNINFENTEYLTYYFVATHKSYNMNIIKLPHYYKSDWYLTLDYQEDLDLFEKIYNKYKDQKYISFNILKQFFKNFDYQDYNRVIGLGSDWKQTMNMLNETCKNLDNFEKCHDIKTKLLEIYEEQEKNRQKKEIQTYDGKTVKK